METKPGNELHGVVPKNKVVQELLAKLKEKGFEIKVFEKGIKDEQNRCPHIKKLTNTKWEYDPYGEKMVHAIINHTCLDCGRTIPRKQGGPFEVCIVCEGKMVCTGTTPGQGEHYVNYKCTVCKREISHT